MKEREEKRAREKEKRRGKKRERSTNPLSPLFPNSISPWRGPMTTGEREGGVLPLQA